MLTSPSAPFYAIAGTPATQPYSRVTDGVRTSDAGATQALRQAPAVHGERPSRIQRGRRRRGGSFAMWLGTGVLGVLAAATAFTLTVHAGNARTANVPPIELTPTTVLEPEALPSGAAPAAVADAPAPKAFVPSVAKPSNASTTPARVQPAAAPAAPVVAQRVPAEPAPVEPAPVEPAPPVVAQPAPPVLVRPGRILKPVPGTANKTPAAAGAQTRPTASNDSASASAGSKVERPTTPVRERLRVPTIRPRMPAAGKQPKASVPVGGRMMERTPSTHSRVPVEIGTR